MVGRRDLAAASVAGILWPVLAIPRIFLTGELDEPSWTDSREAITDFYAGASFDGAFVVGMAMVTVAYLLLVVFLAKAAEVVDGGPDGPGWLGRLMVGGALLDVAVVVVYLATFATATFWASHGGLSEGGTLALHGLSYSVYWLDLLVAGLWIVPFGVAILRSGGLPRWLGWVLLANQVALVGTFFTSSVDVWNAVSGLPYLWVLVAATLLLGRAARPVREG
jgi:hypothetical protein